MEIRVELDEDLVEELDDEAMLQGFDDTDAYLRWILAHRPMSDLATTQAPAVASRVSELEERVTLLERQLDFEQPQDPDSDLEASGSGASLDTNSSADLESSGGASLGDDLDTETETVDLEDPQDEPEQEEDAAEDDDIAEAIGEVSLDDDAEDDEDGT